MCGLSNICSMVVVMIGNMFQVVIFQGHQEVYQGITRNTETPRYITVLQISGYHQKYGNSGIYHGPTNISVSPGIRKLRDISRSYKYRGITRNSETPGYITVLQISWYHYAGIRCGALTILHIYIYTFFIFNSVFFHHAIHYSFWHNLL